MSSAAREAVAQEAVAQETAAPEPAATAGAAAPADQLAGAALPDGMPKLPEPRSGPSGLLLSPKNVDSFRGVLLAPIAAWLEARLFAARVFARLDFAWDYSPRWAEATIHNMLRYSIDDQQSLVRTPLQEQEEEIVGGFPFGRAADIDLEGDPVLKAYKILWNVASLEGMTEDVLYEGDLSWLGTQSLLKSSEAILYRRTTLEPYFEQLPAAEDAANQAPTPAATAAPSPTAAAPANQFAAPGDILRRELFRLSAPPVVYGLAQIFWRYRGPQDDRGWVVSPVTGKSRRVFGANRSDGLVGSMLTLDDLFCWSGKVQSFDARVVAEKLLLVPFPSLTAYEFAAEKGAPSESAGVLTIRGHHQRTDGQPATALWNYQTRHFSGLAPWVPTSAAMVPREVWILQLEPRDPYYTSGRQLLVVDKTSMLPVYKLVYDQAGEFSRMVAAGWGLGRTSDLQVVMPFAGFVFSVDRGAKRAMLFTPRVIRTFVNQQLPAVVQLKKLLYVENHDLEQQEPHQEEIDLPLSSPQAVHIPHPAPEVDPVEIVTPGTDDYRDAPAVEDSGGVGSEADFLP